MRTMQLVPGRLSIERADVMLNALMQTVRRSRRPALRATREEPAYRYLAEQLRAAIRESNSPETRLPTEAELALLHGVSRQTVRRAYQELVSEGVVRRVPRLGSFPVTGRYMRSVGTIDDLMALGDDTLFEVVRPLSLVVRPKSTGNLAVDELYELTSRRLHQGAPFACAVISLPAKIGERLMKTFLAREGSRRRTTVIELIEATIGTTVAEARQVITVDPLPSDMAPLIDMNAGDPVLRIDRVYRDVAGTAVEMTTNYFNPARYSYTLQMRRTSSGRKA